MAAVVIKAIGNKSRKPHINLKRKDVKEMDGGRVYVVYNDWIQNPEAEEGTMTYKIGITAASAKDRLYGLGLKMPNEFECEFEYEFDDERYKKVEKTLHDLLSMSHVGGEWVIEIKVAYNDNGKALAQEALEQINAKQYADPFATAKKLGIAIDDKTRQISDWVTS